MKTEDMIDMQQRKQIYQMMAEDLGPDRVLKEEETP